MPHPRRSGAAASVGNSRQQQRTHDLVGSAGWRALSSATAAAPAPCARGRPRRERRARHEHTARCQASRHRQPPSLAAAVCKPPAGTEVSPQVGLRRDASGSFDAPAFDEPRRTPLDNQLHQRRLRRRRSHRRLSDGVVGERDD
eukprot:3935387-Prymnesium_polylepis.2